jgi:D-ribose pyranase
MFQRRQYMKKTALLNSNLSSIIGKMGHTDEITVADCGLPVPFDEQRVDLAVTRGVPGFFQVLEAILLELQVEAAVIASEMKENSPETYKKLKELLPEIEWIEIPHSEFKDRTKNSKCVVRTGECTPYANIILISGVAF